MREPDYEKALDSILPRKPTGRPAKKPYIRKGRPKLPEGKHRVSLTVSLSPSLRNALEAERRRKSDNSPRNRYSASQVVEDALRLLIGHEDRKTLEGEIAYLSAELKYFYELGREARSVWWRNQSGLPGEIDGVLEKLTKKFIAYQKSRNIEEPLYPPEPEEAEEGGFVL